MGNQEKSGVFFDGMDATDAMNAESFLRHYSFFSGNPGTNPPMSRLATHSPPSTPDPSSTTEDLLHRCHLLHTLDKMGTVPLCVSSHLQLRTEGDTFTAEESVRVCRQMDTLWGLVHSGQLKEAKCGVCGWEWLSTRVWERGDGARCEGCR